MSRIAVGLAINPCNWVLSDDDNYLHFTVLVEGWNAQRTPLRLGVMRTIHFMPYFRVKQSFRVFVIHRSIEDEGPLMQSKE